MISQLYRRLKRNRSSSKLLKQFDFIIPKKLRSHTNTLYVRLISNHWVNESYEKEIRSNFLKICSEMDAKVFFDIGANVGIYSLDFISINDSNISLAFEPNPRVSSCLEKTASKVKRTRMQVFRFALSNQKGETNLKFDPMAPSRGGIVPIENDKYNHELAYSGISETLSVPTSTLDFMVLEKNITPDIIKIDAEGAEYMILQGGLNLLANRKPTILLECTRDLEEMKDLLYSLGYVFYNTKLQKINELEWMVFAFHPNTFLPRSN